VDRLRVAIFIDTATVTIAFLPGIYLIDHWKALGAALFIVLCHAGSIAHLAYVTRYFRHTPDSAPSRRTS
jgi:hypothetical protein